MTLFENAVLLLLGLGTGILAATIAVMPHLLASNASIPWLSLAVILLLVLFVGLASGFAAVRQTLKNPTLLALKEGS
jgi:putative ABC transport system permease protein